MTNDAAMRMSEVLIEMLRSERARGFKDDVAPSGLGGLLDEYATVIPPDVATRMASYRGSDARGRRSIINDIGPRLSRGYKAAYGRNPDLPEARKVIMGEYLDLWHKIVKATQEADQRDSSWRLDERGHSKYHRMPERVVTPPSAEWSSARARLRALHAVLHGEAEISSLAASAAVANPLAASDAPHVELHSRFSRSYPGAVHEGGGVVAGNAAGRVPVFFERDGLTLEAHIDVEALKRMANPPSPDAIAAVEARVKSINERRQPYRYEGELKNAVASLIGVRPGWR